jgi:hypothetical protein
MSVDTTEPPTTMALAAAAWKLSTRYAAKVLRPQQTSLARSTNGASPRRKATGGMRGTSSELSRRA